MKIIKLDGDDGHDDDDGQDGQDEDRTQSIMMKIEYYDDNDDNEDGRCISHFSLVIQKSEEIGPTVQKTPFIRFPSLTVTVCLAQHALKP